MIKKLKKYVIEFPLIKTKNIFIHLNKYNNMKKSILNLGKALNKKDQKKINGGSSNTINICKCDYRTGRWTTPGCGTQDCYIVQDDDDELPCSFTLINGLAICI